MMTVKMVVTIAIDADNKLDAISLPCIFSFDPHNNSIE